MGKRFSTGVACVVGLSLMALPASALGSTVTVGSGKLTVTAAGGEANNVSVEIVGATFRVIDTGAGLTAGAGCTANGPNQASCPTAGITGITANLGNLDDDAGIVNGTIPATINGGAGTDRLIGAGGADQLNAGATPPAGSTEVLAGFGGPDVLTGSNTTGSSAMSGGEGSDDMRGGRGLDSFAGDPGADSVRGGDGVDSMTYAAYPAGVNVSLDGVANDGTPGEGDNIAADVEGITGTGFADTLTGTAGSQGFVGGGAGDQIDGGPAMDYIDGSDGVDTLNGGDGNDGMIGAGGADNFIGGDGWDGVAYIDKSANTTITINNTANDGIAGEADNVRTDIEEVFGGNANDTITGSAEDNTILGGAGVDNLSGGVGNDTLTGEGFPSFSPFGFGVSFNYGFPSPTPGADTLNGNGDDDTLDGGGLGDILIGAAGEDMASYSTSGVGVTVTIGTGVNDGAPGENDDVRADVEGVTGGMGADNITGNGAANTLIGSAGQDELHGADGKDYLDGNGGPPGGPGSSADVLDGGGGADTVSYASTNGMGVTVDIDGVADDGAGGTEGDNVQTTVENVVGSHFADSLTGSSAANLLFGRDGTDTLNGLGAADTLDGGNDVDTNNGGDGGDFLKSRSDVSSTTGAPTTDTNNCGIGSDRVVADAFDTNNADCESVTT